MPRSDIDFSDNLSEQELKVLDAAFVAIFSAAADFGVTLTAGEACERAGEAVAEWIVTSRGK